MGDNSRGGIRSSHFDSVAVIPGVANQVLAATWPGSRPQVRHVGRTAQLQKV